MITGANPELKHVLRRVKAVAFDAVGTLIYAEPSVSLAYCQLLNASCGVAVAPDRVRAVLSARLSERTSGDSLSTSEDQERQFWYELIAELVEDHSRRESAFETLFAYFAKAENWRCFDDVAATLRSLKNRGLKLLLASNFDQRLHSVKAGLPELDGIASVVVSSEVGWRKPSANFFRGVSYHAGCEPNEILFVGDDLTADVIGSSHSGMNAVWLRRSPGGVPKVSLPESFPASAFQIQQLQELCVDA
jgi:putative hydrolase of the HAD superfamily